MKRTTLRAWAARMAALALVALSFGVVVGRDSDTTQTLPDAPTSGVEFGTAAGAEPAATLPPVDDTAPIRPLVGDIEVVTSLVPGFITVVGWADRGHGSEPVLVTAWVDGTERGAVAALDEYETEAGDPTEAGFVFDLAVDEGEHTVCITGDESVGDTVECVEVITGAVDDDSQDPSIRLTGVTPRRDGTVDVRGVIVGGTDAPTSVNVASAVGVVTEHLGTAVVTQLAVANRTFRFQLHELDDGTTFVCPEGMTIRVRTPDPTWVFGVEPGCGTAVLGDVSIGATGQPAQIDVVEPPTDHALNAMERDAGVSVELTDGSMMWFFGDTMERTSGGGLRYFVNNTAAWAAAEFPTVTLDAVTESGRPVLFAEPPADLCDGSRFDKPALWPEAAVAIAQADGTDRVVVVMSKVCLGVAWLDIENVGYAIAEFRYDPTDPPIGRPIVGSVTQPDLATAVDGYGRALTMAPDGFLYGQHCGYFPDDWGPCEVGRVEPDAVTDPAAWRYWNGGDWTDQASWVADESSAAPMDLPATDPYPLPVAAFGLAYDPDLEAYLMVYTPWPGPGERVAVRVAQAPVGPWSEPVGVTLPDCTGEIAGMTQHCYAGTPQLQLCEAGMVACGYFDMLTDAGHGEYRTVLTPFVVVRRNG